MSGSTAGGEGPDELERLVTGAFRVFRRRFADLRFVAPGGVLEVTKRVEQVTRVRVESPATVRLHLATFLVEAEGVDDLACRTRATASSRARADSNDGLTDGRLFDPRNRRLSFQTRTEQRPWVQLEFDGPVNLTRIFLRNRRDPTSVRARGLQIFAQATDGRWTRVYDGGIRERELADRLQQTYAGQQPRRMDSLDGTAGGTATRWRRLLRRCTPPSGSPVRHSARQHPVDPVGADLIRVLTALLLGQYAAAVRDLERVALPEVEKARFRRIVDARILARRKLTWTSHGVHRSFQFWSRSEQEAYVSFAAQVLEDLRDLTDDVCFGFGSALAIVRDQALIPHDDDMDIIIGFDPARAATLADALVLIGEHLAAKGYTATGPHLAHRWIKKPGTPFKVDVFVGIFEGDTIAWYPGRRGALTRGMVFPPIARELLGVACRIPNDPERYLSQVYGPGWDVPDPDFSHPWDPQEYADLVR